MSSPFEWRIQDIERTARRAEDRLHELDSLRRDVGSLEHTVRELRAEIDEREQQIAKQSAALKLARGAILKLCGGYPHGFRKANEALAAIDALGEAE